MNWECKMVPWSGQARNRNQEQKSANCAIQTEKQDDFDVATTSHIELMHDFTDQNLENKLRIKRERWRESDKIKNIFWMND